MTSKKLFGFLLLCSLGATACNRNKAAQADAAAPAVAAAAPGAARAPSAALPFDVASVPVSHAALPPFPYLAWPRDLDKGMATEEKQVDFDAVQLLAGTEMRTVQGKIDELGFVNETAKYSALSSRRNYEAAVKALGGVKVNQVGPDDEALVKKYGDRLQELDAEHVGGGETYDVYLLRAPERNIWFTVMITVDKTFVRVIEEKPMTQTVGYVKADAMLGALDASGHIALYIQFDTDKATVRADGKPAVDEIATLLKNNPSIKLTIEGHTDNSGDAAHNKTLSQQRADTVLTALVAGGIDKARLKAVGVGAAKPIADNAFDDGRAKNRRVELVKG
jgi:OOP family OmpA-OmpF porin